MICGVWESLKIRCLLGQVPKKIYKNLILHLRKSDKTQGNGLDISIAGVELEELGEQLLSSKSFKLEISMLPFLQMEERSHHKEFLDFRNFWMSEISEFRDFRN